MEARHWRRSFRLKERLLFPLLFFTDRAEQCQRWKRWLISPSAQQATNNFVIMSSAMRSWFSVDVGLLQNTLFLGSGWQMKHVMSQQIYWMHAIKKGRSVSASYQSSWGSKLHGHLKYTAFTSVQWIITSTHHTAILFRLGVIWGPLDMLPFVNTDIFSSI